LGSRLEAVGKLIDTPTVWAEMAHNLRAEAIEQCGHLPHEEQPDRVNGLLLEFLAGADDLNDDLAY
jgi:haloacetate dehalogenase